MKTPVARPNAVRIIVQPPDGPIVPAVSGERLSGSEAWQIVKAIGPKFADYASQYDTKKYWPEVYERVGQEFRQPETVGPGTLRDALLWKDGHLRKAAIPPAHERLISQLQRGWPAAVAALPIAPEDAFVALDRDFGGKTRFITVAFSLHLLHPRKVPIIDQHNSGESTRSWLVSARLGRLGRNHLSTPTSHSSRCLWRPCSRRGYFERPSRRRAVVTSTSS